MGWQEFLMKHGVGSPGYIAKTMAKQYRAIRESNPSLDELAVLGRLYSTRVVAQSVLGGPTEYQRTRENPAFVHAVIRQNPNLFLIVRYAILVEHPEFQSTYAPSDRFEVLDKVLVEILDREAPDWRNGPKRRIMEPPTPESTDPLGPIDGYPIELALDLFLDACKEPGTLFVTQDWVKPRLEALRELLSEELTLDQSDALRDALMKRAKLDDVIEWLRTSNLPWKAFVEHKKEAAVALRRIMKEQERLAYEKNFAEAEMRWKTKASSPWEAAMRDGDLQAKHDPAVAKAEHGHEANPCPKCGSRDLKWFFYISPPPPYELRGVCAPGGWMTACERCNVQVDFFQVMRVHY